MSIKSKWQHMGHVPLLIILQIIFIILFAKFVIYNPDNAVHGPKSIEKGIDELSVYPMFQDVHVMIFIGFGFLMTFLKKYGLSAVSLNMMCAVICLQWATLVIGFFHLHREHTVYDEQGTPHTEEYPYPGVIYLDVNKGLLLSDFAAATILISFGVLIGKTSPLQLIVMCLIEVFLFVVNEVIGRNYIGAIDAGDTIFVHTFGAYFGLAASRVLYSKHVESNKNQGSQYTNDLFSMIGTVFLWMFWPSFNSAATIPGDAQVRAVLNTYFSLCASVLSSFAMSALLNRHNKFVMEHIQNATLAGGVAVGACADLMVQPYGALIIGSVAGTISVVGFEYVSPFLSKKLKMHDSCGVNNLHGMPGIIGSLISCIVVALASKEQYGASLTEIFPLMKTNVEVVDGVEITTPGISPSDQALRQLAALAITIIIAVVGGAVCGFILKLIEKFQKLNEKYRHGATVIKLASSIGNVTGGGVGLNHLMPEEIFFDDNLFFEVNDNEIVVMKRDDVAYNDQLNFDLHHYSNNGESSIIPANIFASGSHSTKMNV